MNQSIRCICTENGRREKVFVLFHCRFFRLRGNCYVLEESENKNYTTIIIAETRKEEITIKETTTKNSLTSHTIDST